MTFKQAVKQMAKGTKSDEAISAIYAEVAPLCKTETESNTDAETTLYDWLSETGGYHGNETPQDIADEWDELSEA